MKKLTILLLILLLLTGCTAEINTKKFTKEKTFLGYIGDSNNDMVLLLNTEIYLTTVDESKKDELIAKATELLTKYHILLDSHHYYKDSNNQLINNIAVLNDSINSGPVKVDPIIIDSLKKAIELVKLTEGYFNFTIGNVSKLYNNKFMPFETFNTDPDILEIKECLKGVIQYETIDNFVIIDEANNTVELKYDRYPYSLDLGAFSKGYIINEVYKELTKYDTSFLLNAGSSSIAAYNKDEEDITWVVGVKDPDDSAKQLYAFESKNNFVSTSGDYERYYFLEDGTRRHHILNPYTGYSENYYRSNTILSTDGGVIDALSTALFNVNDEETISLIINNIENYYNIKISFLMIKPDNQVYLNKLFKEVIIDSLKPTREKEV